MRMIEENKSQNELCSFISARKFVLNYQTFDLSMRMILSGKLTFRKLKIKIINYFKKIVSYQENTNLKLSEKKNSSSSINPFDI